MWDVFICHAWEDKESIARPLAYALQEAGLRVWYDEFTLRVGDSLNRSINYGLSHSRYGVVILSPHFFAKEWPQRELDALVAREVDSGKVILPIWHNVTKKDIKQFSPILADRIGVSTASGLDTVVWELLRVVYPEERKKSQETPKITKRSKKRKDKIREANEKIKKMVVAAIIAVIIVAVVILANDNFSAPPETDYTLPTTSPPTTSPPISITSKIWNILFQYRFPIGLTIYLFNVAFNIRVYRDAKKKGLTLPPGKSFLLILGSFPLFIDLLVPKKL